ncbi:MAG: calcium/sodium antiporter [Mesorhizobium sp.]|nr:calcium/sodium antiporter [Mesorhizobium sp.]MCO5162416.1 calcium/sodium antiporter [Mesorhizobium sp.]
MFLSLLGGLAGLIIGADLLVRGAVGLAQRLGVSSLVIGLTLVGLGTSVPETATALSAVLGGAPGIAVGNIVGANIANCLLIVGVAAAVAPIAVPADFMRREGAALMATTISFVVWGSFFAFDWVAGLVMLALLSLYLWSVSRRSSVSDDVGEETTADLVQREGWRYAFARWFGAYPVASALSLMLGGILLIVFSGNAFVDGAVMLARSLGVSDAVIGVSVVAIGTTSPELITSVVAALRGRPGLALGNAIGSCFFNILGIGGLIGLVEPISIPRSVVVFDFPMLAAATALMLFLAWTGRTVSRREGIALVVCYCTYILTATL